MKEIMLKNKQNYVKALLHNCLQRKLVLKNFQFANIF